MYASRVLGCLPLCSAPRALQRTRCDLPPASGGRRSRGARGAARTVCHRPTRRGRAGSAGCRASSRCSWLQPAAARMPCRPAAAPPARPPAPAPARRPARAARVLPTFARQRSPSACFARTRLPQAAQPCSGASRTGPRRTEPAGAALSGAPRGAPVLLCGDPRARSATARRASFCRREPGCGSVKPGLAARASRVRPDELTSLLGSGAGGPGASGDGGAAGAAAAGAPAAACAAALLAGLFAERRQLRAALADLDAFCRSEGGGPARAAAPPGSRPAAAPACTDAALCGSEAPTHQGPQPALQPGAMAQLPAQQARAGTCSAGAPARPGAPPSAGPPAAPFAGGGGVHCCTCFTAELDEAASQGRAGSALRSAPWADALRWPLARLEAEMASVTRCGAQAPLL